MFKKLIPLLAALLCLCCVLSASADDRTDYYDTIRTYYDTAVSVQDREIAETQLQKLKTYYEKDPDRKAVLNSYQDARLMYYYASGRLAVYDGDFAIAADYFGRCGEFGYEITKYYSYARGMNLASGTDETAYPEAISLLKSVLSDPEFSASADDAITGCKDRYREIMLGKAKKACLSDNHETAQSYYSQILEILPDDAEIRKAYNECLTHTGKVETESSIVIKNAYAAGDTSVVLKWEGEAEKYTIRYMADMKNGSDRQEMPASGGKCTVKGLLPNTTYLFRIECEGAWAEATVKTEKGLDYSDVNGDSLWTGSSTMYCFTRERDKMLDSGKTSYEYYREKNIKPSKDKIIPMYDPAVSDSCILFVFTTFDGIPDSMKGQPYKVLLHVEDRGTLVQEGTFGDEKVCDSNDRIYLLMYDLLDAANDSYPNLSGVAFSVDLLMEGGIVCSSEGTFEKPAEKEPQK